MKKTIFFTLLAIFSSDKSFAQFENDENVPKPRMNRAFNIKNINLYDEVRFGFETPPLRHRSYLEKRVKKNT